MTLLTIYIIGQLVTLIDFVRTRPLTVHDYFTILIWPLWWGGYVISLVALWAYKQQMRRK